MKTYKLKINMEFEREAESEEQALDDLEDEFARGNATAEHIFWDNLEVENA